MNPDTLPTRVLRLESDVARMKQQITDVKHDVESVPALAQSLAEVKVAMQYLQRDQGAVQTAMHGLEQTIAERVDKLAESIEKREENRRAGESSRRWQMYAIIAGFVFVIIAVAAQVIVTLASAA